MAPARKRKQDNPSELGAATSCTPSSEGAGRKRTPAMEHRAVLRPYLHGMETAVMEAYRTKEGKPQFIRYADDVVVFHATEEGIKKAQAVLETWLADVGLALKPSKTKITHTLTPYEGNVGFDFLGFAVRQFPVGKTHTGKNTYGKPLGFKTIISPSKEAIKRHMEEVGKKVRKLRSASQEKLIGTLNPIIRGWAN
jgi:RNA-directed DNA polymerase